MKTLLFLLSLGFSGCMSYDAKLPEVSATEIHIEHHDAAGSITVDAVGVSVDDKTVSAKEYKRVLSYPFTQDTVIIKDYSRNRSPAKQ